MLKPLNTLQQPAEPTFSCEICGTQTPASTTFSLALVYRMPGDANIPAFQCPAEQHFCCSHDHAVQAMQACLSEHIAPLLAQFQAAQAQKTAPA